MSIYCHTAESELNAAQKAPGHPLQVLHIVASNDAADKAVRQSASVHFKNFVKKNWDEAAENVDVITISQSDRDTIKQNVVELMCTVPYQIQQQVSESISLIAAVDFPDKWTNLLPHLISKFDTQDMAVLNGALSTANSILKRFRYVQRNDDLYRDILYTLKVLQEPLLKLFQITGAAVQTYSNDPGQLTPRFAALRTMCGIFYSLNYQDLPEYFEDHMGDWMTEFAKYLQYKNPILVDNDEETEADPVDKLQAAIVINLNLYADKDEEPFLPHLPNFTGLVWQLLLSVSAKPKYDQLATTSIKFLALLVAKQMHRAIFQEESTLREIISKIVVPNLMIRETDEERFEDDPADFILGDIEGSDTESRRKCSQELLRSMCRQFEAETTKICSEHITTMLGEFAQNPKENWAGKDVAIHLMLAISIRAESVQGGVSAVNDKVNVMDFFNTNIVPELQDTNHALRPMVKATALKFVSTFRNQFEKSHLSALIPLLMQHLTSPQIVVHTYAAIAVDKVTTAKVPGSDGKMVAKFQRTDLTPFFEPLFTALFAIVDNPDLAENEYVMKTVMRVLSLSGEDIIPVTQAVLQKLTSVLGRVAKNPRNPQFNHCLFEANAILIRSVCSKDPSYVEAFEGFLFPPFQTILQMDVSEFTPYVFQLLAQLLEYRPAGMGLGPSYESLLPPLTTPALWDRRGNIPALVRLLQAYLAQGSAYIVAQGKLVPMLGIFQKLIASRASEVNGFELLGTMVQKVPIESLQPQLQNLVQVLLVRLQQGKTARYVRSCTQFFGLFVSLFGAQAYFDLLNLLQPGLGLTLLGQVWLPRLATDIPLRLDAKVMVIGLTRMVCETPDLVNDANGKKIWGDLVRQTMTILTSPEAQLGISGNDDDDFEAEIVYDAAYSRLHFAARAVQDAYPEVKDCGLSFAQALGNLCTSHPGKFLAVVHEGLADEKLAGGLATLCQKAGVQLV
jgi:exportin-2 (importin alpha re-exporter)